jgi:transitional endoplasmic reticulum ATPase
MATSTRTHTPRSIPRRLKALRDHQYLATLWCLRLLIRTDLLHVYRSERRFRGDDLLRLTGITELAGDKEIPVRRIMEQVKAHLIELEARRDNAQGTFSDNISTLASALRLTTTECDVLGFFVLLKVNNIFQDIVDTFSSNIVLEQAVSCIAAATGRRRDHVSRSLRPQGILRRSGLVTVSQDANESFSQRFRLLRGLSHAMVTPLQDLQELFAGHFAKGPKARLQIRDFPHVAADASLILEYLGAALPARQLGVNILIYGEPGTGKTEFVRSVVVSLDAPLYEIPATDAGGECLTDDDRLASYRLAQSLLPRSPGSVVLFDEADLALCSARRESMWSALQSNNRTKAWVTQLIERNPVPTIWVANEIHSLEPALIRRFDLVLKMLAPTRTVRKKILCGYLENLGVSEQWIDARAADRRLMPGHIERAARVVRSLGRQNGDAAEASLGRIVDHTLEAMGHTAQAKSVPVELDYSLGYLNPDQDLQAVIRGLCIRPQGRLCLYGPPGTGKTAFAHHLGAEIGQPVISHRASDLLGCYVGETEKKIAQAFREAEVEGGILLLDEVDSFLSERGEAKQSWERTQVNEMLTQMEAFQGVMIASTNLMGRLDQAAMRRFDLKIRFGYLGDEQLWELFVATLNRYGITPSEVEQISLRSRLAGLTTCTPGDFAAIVRRRKVVGRPGLAMALVGDLESEQLVKMDLPKRGIGFLAAISK